MSLSPAATGAVLVSLIVLLLPHATEAHNITRILAKFPEFSTFNHYLTVTHLADDINNRETITVCAVDNAGMSDLLSKNPSISTIKNVLSVHVLLDYFGAKKLHKIIKGTALAATMFQATGSATGTSGFVNITDLKGGKVGFGPEDNGGALPAKFVKSVQEIPYNISVIQISQILSSSEASPQISQILSSSEASAPTPKLPTPEPSQINFTSVMSAHGCKVFAESLLTSDAEKTYADNVDGGLTVFCPGDDAFKAFLGEFKNLTVAGKQSLLEYHAMAVYESLSSLKSTNGVMNTLATDGASNYDFTVQNDGDIVTLKTKLVTAKITGTLIDEQPLAIFIINHVLLPKELFKSSLAPTPAPAPAPDAAADSPKPSKKKHKTPKATDSPADSLDGNVVDDTADGSGASGIDGGRITAVFFSV